jgi:dihydrofolate reductase
MNLGLIDELRLAVHPIVLGGGKALFKDVRERYTLKLVWAKRLKSGKVWPDLWHTTTKYVTSMKEKAFGSKSDTAYIAGL